MLPKGVSLNFEEIFSHFSSLHFLCMYCLLLTLLWYIGFFGTIHPSLWQNNNLRNNIHCKEPAIRTRKEHLLHHPLRFIATPLAVVESSWHKTYLMFTTFKLTHARTYSLTCSPTLLFTQWLLLFTV